MQRFGQKWLLRGLILATICIVVWEASHSLQDVLQKSEVMFFQASKNVLKPGRTEERTEKKEEVTQKTSTPCVANKYQLTNMMMVPYVIGDAFNGYQNVKEVNQSARIQRMDEIHDSIQKTLNQSFVGCLYIFYKDPDLIPYMKNATKYHFDKIIFVHHPEDTFPGVFKYALRYLRDRVVMVSNADVYPGEGFDQLDYDYLREKNVMYTLSRHGRKEKYCDLSRDKYTNKCRRRGTATGSMDAHIFNPKLNFTKEQYKLMDFPPTSFAIENAIAWVFRDAGYAVTNPCNILNIYHVHCGARAQRGMWAKTEHRQFMPKVTNTLYPGAAEWNRKLWHGDRPRKY